jgi:hypothetical protein
MKPSTIRGIHGILSGAFTAAQRWEWTDRNPAESAKPPTTIRRPIPATSPEDVAKVITEARTRNAALGLYLWLVVVTGVRRGELCGLQIRDIDLDRGLVHVAFNYVVRGGQRVRKDTKTHQDRWLAIDPDTCALIVSYLDEISAMLAAVGVELRDDAYLFSIDLAHAGRGTRAGAPARSLRPRMPLGRARYQGRPALHRQPAPSRRLHPAQHRRRFGRPSATTGLSLDQAQGACSRSCADQVALPGMPMSAISGTLFRSLLLGIRLRTAAPGASMGANSGFGFAHLTEQLFENLRNLGIRPDLPHALTSRFR